MNQVANLNQRTSELSSNKLKLLRQVENIRMLQGIIKSQAQGLTGLSSCLGLQKEQKLQLLNFCHLNYKHAPPALKKNDDLLLELKELRKQEAQDLNQLLISARNGEHEVELWLAQIISLASLGSAHLWRALGLQSRSDLKLLLLNNFHSLATKNNKNMRWKKFFYKQLCEQGGHYVCRSPSCESCTSYNECFAEEL
ncbi:nitrogen fixation protein NifQ [Agaribacterium sp. ZY112]|uniref:nitrogen fixation protein NifQ n=1 Tax=Agaribacterium sp. ZY112 TaxID=3233574 RepID=UPI003523D67A